MGIFEQSASSSKTLTVCTSNKICGASTGTRNCCDVRRNAVHVATLRSRSTFRRYQVVRKYGGVDHAEHEIVFTLFFLSQWPSYSETRIWVCMFYCHCEIVHSLHGLCGKSQLFSFLGRYNLGGVALELVFSLVDGLTSTLPAYMKDMLSRTAYQHMLLSLNTSKNVAYDNKNISCKL